VANGSEKLYAFYGPLIWERMAEHAVVLNGIQKKTHSEPLISRIPKG